MYCRHERAIIGLEIYCPAWHESFLPGTEAYRFILRQMDRAERNDCKRFQLKRRKSYVRHYSGGFYAVISPPPSPAAISAEQQSTAVQRPAVPVRNVPATKPKAQEGKQLGFLSF